MNFRQSYEQLIADKLRQLPARDADASWQQMKRLLDEDDDRGAGGGKRPPGNGWWRIAVLVLFFATGLWLYSEYKQPPAGNLARTHTGPLPAAAANNAAPNTSSSNSIKTQTIDQKTTLNSNNETAASSAEPITSSNATRPERGSTSSSTTSQNTTASPIPGHTDEVTATREGSTPVSGTVAAGNPTKANRLSNPAAGNLDNNSTAGRAADRQKGSPVMGNRYNNFSGSSPLGANQKNTGMNARSIEGITPDASRTASRSPEKQPASNIAVTPANRRIAGRGSQVNEGNSYYDAPSFSSPQAVAARTTGIPHLPPMETAGQPSAFNTALLTGDSMLTGPGSASLLSAETTKEVAKAKRDQEIALLDKKDKKTFRLNLSNVFKPFSLHATTDPWWAAGIALNATIPMGAQSRYNYNVNAKSGTLTDYIPSPYLQFHLNNYVYLQTELNFISPQYTPQLLAFRQTNDLSVQGQGGMSQQKSIYIQKMYYFNWPVSLHYSPVSNLYFSGGIQFSSFQSGLAAIEEKQYNTLLGPDHASSTASTRLLKFKDDSIAAKIAPNEWRWQVGAEYYWNRFSIGLRYNQSLKKAINSIPGAGLPATVSRNEAMLFFVRYNIFESRRSK